MQPKTAHVHEIARCTQIGFASVARGMSGVQSQAERPIRSATTITSPAIRAGLICGSHSLLIARAGSPAVMDVMIVQAGLFVVRQASLAN
jgi:hypothetical protein